MPPKRLHWRNGEVADECDHEGTILDRPGANTVCYNCGEVVDTDD